MLSLKKKYYVVALIVVALLVIIPGLFFEIAGEDESTHAMDTMFYRDAVAAFSQGKLSPGEVISYVSNYYSTYPALTINFYPPFYHLVTIPVYVFVSDSLLAPRLVTALFALVFILYWFKLVDFHFDSKTAFWSSLLVLLLPFFTQYMRYIMLDIPLWALATACLYYYSVYLKNEDRRSLYLAGAFLILATFTKTQAIAIPAILFMYTLFVKGKSFPKFIQKGDLLIISFFYILFASAWFYFLSTIGSSLFKFADGSVGSSSLLSIQPWVYYLSVLPVQVTIPILFFSGIFILRRVYTRSIPEREYLFFAIILSIYAVFSIISFKGPRFTMYLIPVLALFAVLSAQELPKQWSNSFSMVILAVLVISSAYATSIHHFPHTNGYEEAAQSMAPIIGNGNVFYNDKVNLALIYYLRVYDQSPSSRILLRSQRLLIHMDVGSTDYVAVIQTPEEFLSLLDTYNVHYVITEGRHSNIPEKVELDSFVAESDQFTLVTEHVVESTMYEVPTFPVRLYEYTQFDPRKESSPLLYPIFEKLS